MTVMTDPARELVDLCMDLATPSNMRGDEFLAGQFETIVWSSEFYQIIFAISARCDQLIAIIKSSMLDEDFKTHLVSNVEQIREAFTPSGLQNPWSHSVNNYISPANVGALRGFSLSIREKYACPKLSVEEKDILLAQVDVLLSWLVEHQLHEKDFIRQVLIDGIVQFRFRLDRINWLGWGYAIESLREVISAYMALENGIDASTAPDAAVMLKKLAGFVEVVFAKIATTRQTIGDSAFMILAYEEVSKYAVGNSSVAEILKLTAS